MNADGLYLLAYCALLLNLKLCCCDYYRRRTLASGLGLVSPGLCSDLSVSMHHPFFIDSHKSLQDHNQHIFFSTFGKNEARKVMLFFVGLFGDNPASNSSQDAAICNPALRERLYSNQ